MRSRFHCHRTRYGASSEFQRVRKQIAERPALFAIQYTILSRSDLTLDLRRRNMEPILIYFRIPDSSARESAPLLSKKARRRPGTVALHASFPENTFPDLHWPCFVGWMYILLANDEENSR
jgi:hypothetical protein